MPGRLGDALAGGRVSRCRWPVRFRCTRPVKSPGGRDGAGLINFLMEMSYDGSRCLRSRVTLRTRVARRAGEAGGRTNGWKNRESLFWLCTCRGRTMSRVYRTSSGLIKSVARERV